MMRLGLCCIFRDEPIRFRRATASVLGRLTCAERRRRLADICGDNASSLLAALRYCAANGIGDFRINSQILPLKTHPDVGYDLDRLPGGKDIVARFEECGAFAREAGLRTTFHPDQFVVLNSPNPATVEASIRELEYQAEVAEWVGADVINIHGGGGYGDKPNALKRFGKAFRLLSAAVRHRLTVENDEKTYTPVELLPLCADLGMPLVYDVHHHRCLPDGAGVEETTRLALQTWNREPLFHVSSPRRGWKGPRPSEHHDFINPGDFPKAWLGLDITVEVEAKAKELAVARLHRWLAAQ